MSRISTALKGRQPGSWTLRLRCVVVCQPQKEPGAVYGVAVEGNSYTQSLEFEL